MATKNNNTLLYAGLGLAAFMLLRKRDNSELSGIGASKEFIITGRVISTKYRNTSGSGNPSYWVELETPEGRILKGYTAPNSSLAYGITNPEYKERYWNFVSKEGARGLTIHYVI